MNKARRYFRKSTSLLRGKDGRISFSKAVLVTILYGWLTGRTIDAALAFVLVGASYGWRWVQLRTQRSESYPEADRVE